ncbi:class I SAM-dependent methyltransferase [Paracraurococcus lichenis]|uniref:Class I SAM-dependent methyltransferase n=1 Tax=Paracraurococcus lichenis TaxID=3064888 RepID=A0ABT9E727_9PROT|nr:class I SAM-dependent methyltransferase [Paracraurococcus sp. LOR1-02]MDO9711946.1 class I SAM-dependent methyltransferase [Paracraurococcus sp. LOR1-02]
MSSTDTRSIYTGQAYAESRPTWHEEDSPWKAKQILEILKRNNINPRKIVDVGCGAGGVLQSTVEGLAPGARGEGFDIAPYAISKAQQKSDPSLNFRCADFSNSDYAEYDLLLCIDVFEHVEDYIGFLRKIRGKSKYFVFHIPLDMNAKGILRNHHMKERREVGHLHYFDFKTALSTLQDTGYEVIDHFYTRKPTNNLLTKTITATEHVLAALTDRHFAVKVLGGVSLLVLGRASE